MGGVVANWRPRLAGSSVPWPSTVQVPRKMLRWLQGPVTEWCARKIGMLGDDWGDEGTMGRGKGAEGRKSGDWVGVFEKRKC